MKRKKEIQPHWRPNFRIQSTLPDIKVVRTDFMINSIALALVLVAFFFLLQRVYSAYSMRATIEDMEQRLRVAEADNKQSLQVSARFRKAAEHVVELQRFYGWPLSAHEFLAQLALLKPKDLSFSQVMLSETIVKEGKDDLTGKVGYRIEITGEVLELTVLNEFKGALQQLELLNPAGFASVVDESMEQRDAKTGIIPFRISIAVSVEKAAKKNKGAKG